MKFKFKIGDKVRIVRFMNDVTGTEDWKKRMSKLVGNIYEIEGIEDNKYYVLDINKGSDCSLWKEEELELYGFLDIEDFLI